MAMKEKEIKEKKQRIISCLLEEHNAKMTKFMMAIKEGKRVPIKAITAELHFMGEQMEKLNQWIEQERKGLNKKPFLRKLALVKKKRR
jgi:hypothetical protein